MPHTISIITICLNSQEHIRGTLESVKNQSRQPYEFIVVDGGSTDNTNSIIAKYGDIVSKHLSEPDKGISDAMNKGIGLASGDFVLFLNSDDFLVDDRVIEDVGALLDDQHDIHAFDIIFKSRSDEKRIPPRCFNFWTNFKIPFCHQGVLCRRRLFEKLGGFDLSFNINMDYDFFLRAFRNNTSVKYHPRVNVVMRDTGISSRTDWPGLRERFAEERMAQKNNSPSKFMEILYAFYWFFYIPYRRIRYASGR